MNQILVICGDAETRRSLRESLEEAGHRIVEAETGREGLSIASKSPDLSLVIVDLEAKNPSGLEVCGLLRSNTEGHRAPIIGLASQDDADLLDEALSSGVDDVIRVPLVDGLVSTRVAVQLRNRQLQASLTEQKADLELLLDLSWRLAATVDVREILFELVSRIAGALSIDRCSLVLSDESGRRGVVLAASDNETLEDLEIDLASYPEIQRVLSSGEPLVLQNVADHPLLAQVKETLAAQGVWALAAFPLQHHDEPMGVLLLRASARHGPFPEQTIRLARTIAHTTAIALRNARLFERITKESVRASEGKAQAEKEVADLKQVETELRKTKTFLENLIDSSNDAIVAADMKGRIIVWNKTAERILGYSREEATKMHVFDIYDEDARDIMAALRSDSKGEKGKLERTVQVVSKDEERIPVSLSAAVLYEDGREIATVGLLTDIRDRLRIEEKLSDAQERLVDSEKAAAIAELAGTTAHELNQPLTSIMGYSEMMQRRMPEDDPNQRALNIIFRESDRMAKIVRKIGQITRYKTKDYLGKTRIVDLDQSVDESD